MPASPPLTPRLIGQTEKAMNALLERELSGTGITEPQWVTLVLAVASRPALDHRSFADQVVGALKVGDADARARIAELAAAGLLDAPGEGSELSVTEAGLRLYDRVRAATGEITRRLWGDLPDAELATTAKVLGSVLQRANAELASGSSPGTPRRAPGT